MKLGWVMFAILAIPVLPAEGQEKIGDAWSDDRNPIVKIFGGQRLDLWSLKPVTPPTPPPVTNQSWIRNPIDQFVLARLEANGLEPSPKASRQTLSRRLYFNLTGLPPTPEEMQEFVNDDSDSAYEHLVDRLLASSRYGEHWARHWLDVIRYSDSNGFDWDEFRRNAWRFRDYTIRAFNTDKPFDRFIIEQIAGDELLDGPPQTLAEQDALIATTYLRLGPQDNSASLFDEQARSRAELMFDLVETTGAAFLGLTMSCSRCHDHKFDPISQADYYRMRAFFEPVEYANELPIDLAHEQRAIVAHNKSIDQQIQPIQAARDALLAAVRDRLRVSFSNQLSLERSQDPIEKEPGSQENDSDRKKPDPTDEEVQKALTPEQKKTVDYLAQQIDELRRKKKSFTFALLMTDRAGEPPATHVLYAGNHKDPREIVVPGFLSVLNPNPARIIKPPNGKTTGRRMALAEWIASEANPLTARVFVNRVWQAHFGQGLVTTPNDFGLAGAPPSHPELLDWLASEFVRGGWSIKRLHRLIVTSATFQQSSGVNPQMATRDAANELLWRQNLKRLSAEQLRDSLLAVAGSLRQTAGGPPVWPELPAEILAANPALLDDNAEKIKGWYPSPPPERPVRSIYLIQKRTVRVPFMETFDLPENSTSCPRRGESIVAPQALALLNNPMPLEAARNLAERIEQESSNAPAARVQRLFELALQRPPNAHELRDCADFLEEHSLTELCRVMINLNEFIYLD